MLFGKQINRYYFRYLPFFILGIIALLAVDYFQLMIPELFGELIDNINENLLTYEGLLTTVKTLIVIIVVMFLGRFLWRVTIFGMAVRLETHLRRRMFIKIEQLSQEYFSNHKTGAQMALFTNDLQMIRACFGRGTMMLVDALFLGVLTFYKMFNLQKVLSIVSLIPLLLTGVCGVIIGKYMSLKFKRRQEAFESLSDFTQENFSGIMVVKAFVKEFNELHRFRKINKENEEANMDFLRFGIRLDVLFSAIINLIILIIIGIGSYYVITTRDNIEPFTIGNLSTFIAYFGTLIWPMMAVSQLINLTAQGRASLKRITNLLNEEPTVKDSPDILKAAELKGKIEFRNLTFNYPNVDEPTLKNISFIINPGEKIGIIGKTGAGKTTIVDLLLRMYNVHEGQLFIDDIDITKLPIKQVRQLISFVPQDNFLFGMSVRDNIRFAIDEEVSNEEISNVAKLADIEENILEFSQSYETLLGERGVTISGGQKQRLSIARALLKKAKILILDDSVSAVDTKTEATILNNLKKNYNDSTVVMIAHRISTVQDLDKIILIDEGEIIGFDTHQNLYNKSKLYREMVDLQKLEAKIEGENHE